MWLNQGNGGWVLATAVDALPDGAQVFVRFKVDDVTDRLVPCEVYIELGERSDRLGGEHLRRLPLDLIEAYANTGGGEQLRERMGRPAPQLGVMASYFQTSLGRVVDSDQIPTWIEQCFWSQLDPPLYERVRRYRTRAPSKPPADVPPSFGPPPEGRYTDEWFQSLARAYTYAVRAWKEKRGKPPAIALAEQAQVATTTVRSWIYRARQANHMPKGSRGRAG